MLAPAPGAGTLPPPTAFVLPSRAPSLPHQSSRAEQNTPPRRNPECPFISSGWDEIRHRVYLGWDGEAKQIQTEQGQRVHPWSQAGARKALYQARRERAVLPQSPRSGSHQSASLRQAKGALSSGSARVLGRAPEGSVFWEELPTERVPEEAREGQAQQPCRLSQGHGRLHCPWGLGLPRETSWRVSTPFTMEK